jgi:glycosyltransferase involved in cell wall biosynthesis
VDGLDLTLLICTHNNAQMLDRSLETIARQVLPPEAGWEVLVVGNRCTDRTADVVRGWGEKGRIPQLRYVSERRLGISFARKRGLRESLGRLIGLVDDDCLLDPDWAARALRFAEEEPRAGAFGGRNELLWEVPPPPIAELYGESLARPAEGAAGSTSARRPRLCGRSTPDRWFVSPSTGTPRKRSRQRDSNTEGLSCA